MDKMEHKLSDLASAKRVNYRYAAIWLLVWVKMTERGIEQYLEKCISALPPYV